MKFDLHFISEEKLTEICADIVQKGQSAVVNSDEKLFDNIVDPFSALFDSAISGITLSEWIKREKTRQMQKTLQNAIGTFHQNVIGSIDGWEDLGTGNIIDLRCQSKKILAEVKNKWNTTKGNHKVRVYDDIKKLLEQPKNKGFKGYYVAILSKAKINAPFTPSDNETSSRRPIDENIVEVDGATFYDIATGEKDSLKKLYQTLPYILSNILNNKDIEKYLREPIFNILSEKSLDLMN
mgnify:CR=1 FL=1